MSDPSIWNRYWQFDRIASCFDGAGARNYDEFVVDGWQAFFAGLPTGARILDLCSGNGAVSLIAAETSRAEKKRFAIIAVDQAEIDPVRHVTRHREALAAIDFRPGTEAEALPFTDRCFDAAVSQYGIEYSDLSRSLPELRRVVAPGGRVRLVMHAAEGLVTGEARRVLDEADFLLDGADLPGAARRCFEAVSAAERMRDASAATHARARDALKAFEAALAQTAARIPAALDKVMLRNSGAVLLDTFKRRARLDVVQLLDKAEDVRAEIVAHRGRLQALIDAAVSAAQARSIGDRLVEAGAADAEYSELRMGPALIGHVVEARFPE